MRALFRVGKETQMLSGAEIDVADNVRRVMDEIARTAERVGRDAGSIKLLAVSKMISVDLMQKAMSAGVTCLGENRVQEGIAKRSELAGQKFEYHLIGPLQKNKVNKAVSCFDWLETIDSLELACKINGACLDYDKQMPVLIQVNLAREPTKSGIEEEDLFRLVEQVQALRHLSLRGLMTIPPYFADPDEVRPFFRRLRELLELCNSQCSPEYGMKELSMGMSHDFPTAIIEGATIVRVGTAIFGERQSP